MREIYSGREFGSSTIGQRHTFTKSDPREGGESENGKFSGRSPTHDLFYIFFFCSHVFKIALDGLEIAIVFIFLRFENFFRRMAGIDEILKGGPFFDVFPMFP